MREEGGGASQEAGGGGGASQGIYSIIGLISAVDCSEATVTPLPTFSPTIADTKTTILWYFRILHHWGDCHATKSRKIF